MGIRIPGVRTGRMGSRQREPRHRQRACRPSVSRARRLLSSPRLETGGVWHGRFPRRKPTHTHEVAPRCQQLGLYDMSGNVWEWCQDTASTTLTRCRATERRGLDTARSGDPGRMSPQLGHPLHSVVPLWNRAGPHDGCIGFRLVGSVLPYFSRAIAKTCQAQSRDWRAGFDTENEPTVRNVEGVRPTAVTSQRPCPSSRRVSGDRELTRRSEARRTRCRRPRL